MLNFLLRKSQKSFVKVCDAENYAEFNG